MTDLCMQDVAPSSESYFKTDRRFGPKAPLLFEAGEIWGGNTIIESRIRVTGRAGRGYHYRVRCNFCGRERLIRGDKMKRGEGEGGCLRCRKQRTAIPIGTNFDRYTVIDNERILITGIYRVRACLVRCSCGVERLVAYTNLRTANSGSCGCSRFDRRVDQPSYRILLSQLQHRSRRYRKSSCELTLEQFIYISSLPCAYCRTEPDNVFYPRITVAPNKRVRDMDNPFLYSGIDRVDSSKGYVLGNVVPSCFFCNRAKDDWTVEEFNIRLARLGGQICEADIWRLAESIRERFIPTQVLESRGLVH